MGVETASTQARMEAGQASGGQGQGRRWWAVDRVSLFLLLALLPVLGAAIYETASAVLPTLAGSLVIATALTALFAWRRRRAMTWSCLATASVFAVLVPLTTPTWQVFLSLGFGVVVAEQVFGGRGYSFVHPVVASLAFLFFSFPASGIGVENYPLVSVAVVPGALLLLALGVIPWRLMVGVAVGLLVGLLLLGAGTPWVEILTTSLILGVAFLACDPIGAAATNAGRWFYGLLVGMLVVIIGVSGDGIGSPTAIVFATLLGSVFAPLIDRVVMLRNARWRRRRLV